MTAEVINLDERRTINKADEYLRLYFEHSQAAATRYSQHNMTAKEKKDAMPYIIEEVKKRNKK